MQEIELQFMIKAFPGMLKKAIADWAVFKAGVDNDLFSSDERSEIVSWFKSFPKYWKTIRPNWDPEHRPVMSLIPEDAELLSAADLFIKKLGGDIDEIEALGIAPIIVAGVVIAGVFGLAGAIWATGYFKKQGNISKLIEATVAGKLPASVLQEAIERENESIFGGVLSNVKWILIAGALFVLWPNIQAIISRVSKK
jgi:hypothetical protein